MSVIYAAGFQVGGTNTMTCTVAGSAATITSGLYLPGDAWDTNNLEDRDGASAWTLTNYTAFATTVKTVFDAATSSTFTVSFSETTGKYTISRATTFTLSFSGAADLRLRAALGFTGNKSGANTYTSDVIPDYVWLSAMGARTYEGEPQDQEPDDVAEESVDDGGNAEVITKKTSEILATWWQTMEAKSAVYIRAAAAASSTIWTYEDFVKRTRGTHPFVCYDPNSTEAANGTLHRFTAKGAAFRPRRVSPDYDDLWNVAFVTRELGAFT